MSLFDALISALVPYDCLGCGAEGRIVCPSCTRGLSPVPPSCYRCRVASPDFLTCLDCQTASPLYRVQAATVYEGLAKNLVWKLKFGHAQGAAPALAVLMGSLTARQLRGSLLIIPVPTATTRIRQRGYDQARLLARAVGRCVRQPVASALARQSQAHQVGASRQQRRQQLADAFRVVKPRLVRGADIVLIDDVVTTGATLEAAARVLRAAGACRIEALVFAQPKLRQGDVVS